MSHCENPLWRSRSRTLSGSCLFLTVRDQNAGVSASGSMSMLIFSESLLGLGAACPQCAEPVEVMVPWNEPEVKPVFKSVRRSMVKLPLAFVNLPVPPVMVLISVIL